MYFKKLKNILKQPSPFSKVIKNWKKEMLKRELSTKDLKIEKP